MVNCFNLFLHYFLICLYLGLGLGLGLDSSGLGLGLACPGLGLGLGLGTCWTRYRSEFTIFEKHLVISQTVQDTVKYTNSYALDRIGPTLRSS